MAWDPSKPANSTPYASSEIRANWDAVARTIGGVNCYADSTFLLWPGGDTVAPEFTALTGTGAAIQRCGTGLADTNRKVGQFCARVTSGAGAVAQLTQPMIAATPFGAKADFMRAQSVAFGTWVRSPTAGAVRVGVFDGIGVTYSSFHPGGSVWSWLSGVRVLSGSATLLSFIMECAAGTIVGHFSGPTVLMGEVAPSYWMPDPGLQHAYQLPRVPGNLTVSTDKERLFVTRPGIVKHVELFVKTSPATNPVIVDVNTWDGSVFTSMYSTRPQVNASLVRGGAAPDSTYARRCLRSYFGNATPTAGQALSFDIDAIGSGTVGADLDVRVMVYHPMRALEAFFNFDE